MHVLKPDEPWHDNPIDESHSFKFEQFSPYNFLGSF